MELIRVLCVPFGTTELWHEIGSYEVFTRCPAIGELIGTKAGNDTLETAVRVVGVFHRRLDTPVVFFG